MEPDPAWPSKFEKGLPGPKLRQWYIAAISNRGTTCPGTRLSEAAAGPGKAFGRGVAGNANRPLAAAGLLTSAFLRGAALFSALAVAFVVSSPVPLLFCCAQSGKAKSTLTPRAGHKLRISFLLSTINRKLFGSGTRPPTARCLWRTPLDTIQNFHSLPLSLQAFTSPHTYVRTNGET